MTKAPSPRRVVILLALFGALPPAVAYWAFVGRTPTITPDEAKSLLADPETTAVLVDVRTSDEFAEGHIEVAQHWPFDALMAATSSDDLPDALRGRHLLLICRSGILSSLATRHLRQQGILDVENVEGGMQRWVAGAEDPCALGVCQIRSKEGEAQTIATRPSPLVEQWATVLTGFVVKPLYTVLSLALVIVLWRATAPDLVALFWAVTCFFVGENFCAANYLVYNEQSVLFEYLHSYGMVLCFGFATYALLEGMDRRFWKLSDPDARCAAAALCQRCIKHVDAPCGLRRVFQFLIPAMMIVALMPLCAELIPVSYNTTVFGTFYNYSHPIVYQVFEQRYLPLAAFALLGVSMALLKPAKPDGMLWSKVLFAAGTGALGFSFFRLVLLNTYRDHLAWFAAWEEITELLFILGVALVLWTFRRALLPEWRRHTEPH